MQCNQAQPKGRLLTGQGPLLPPCYVISSFSCSFLFVCPASVHGTDDHVDLQQDKQQLVVAETLAVSRFRLCQLWCQSRGFLLMQYCLHVLRRYLLIS